MLLFLELELEEEEAEAAEVEEEVGCKDRGNCSTVMPEDIVIPADSNSDFSLLSAPASSSSSSMALSIFVSTTMVLHSPSTARGPVTGSFVVVDGTTIGIPLLRKCAMR